MFRTSVTGVPASPTPLLLTGLAATLLAAGLFSIYSLRQIETLRILQADTIDRNRRESLQLIRVQSDLNSIGLAMRDMSEDSDGYGIQAWRGEFGRLQRDLEDAFRRLGSISPRPQAQRQYLQQSMAQFWRSADEVFTNAEAGDQNRARRMLTASLQAQQASLTSVVARLLVQNNEAEETAAAEISTIYKTVERNIYLFLTAMLVSITCIGLGAAYYNRRLFNRVAGIAEQRSTLARRLIGLQEEIFRSVSRELHDDFGQILTAIGLMLRRAEKNGSSVRDEIAEIRQVAHEALEKTRSFSQALHPTILDDYGLDYAIERYLPVWEKQSGLTVDFRRDGTGTLPEGKAIHVYRILQEALNNVSKHAKATTARILLQFGTDVARLEIADDGVGIPGQPEIGLGLIGIRERAELLGARLEIGRGPEGGTLVKLEVPLSE